MKKEEIVAISYIDTCYFKKGEKIPENFEFTKHVLVGKIGIVTGSDLTVIFSEKNGKPEQGLVLPIGSLLVKKGYDLNSKLELINKEKIGFDLGVYWKDLVHFQNGVNPGKSTSMFSKGKLFSLNDEAVVLKNPKTTKWKNKIKNHPENENIDIAYLFIPKKLITNLNFYD